MVSAAEDEEMIPVAANDVAFSIHVVLLTAITYFQIAIYDRGTQKISQISIVILVAVWSAALVCFFVALPHESWLWLISVFNTIQVIMTMIKYIPQAVMNFARKSTDGFSIGIILLDFLGGVANYAQMAVQTMDQDINILRPVVHVPTLQPVPIQESGIGRGKQKQR